jgi:hypothetical protein
MVTLPVALLFKAGCVVSYRRAADWRTAETQLGVL